jgi:SHS2 domain-containing protein
MWMTQDRGSGYRLLPHTADVIVEAFGPSMGACFEAAVMGATATFAEMRGVEATGERQVELRPASDEAMLVAVLEEAIFLLDAQDLVVVRAHLPVAGGDGVSGWFDTVDKALVAVVGSPPKAVAYHELELIGDASGYKCRFVLDV